MPQRAFTVAEVDGMIPHLEGVLTGVREALGRLSELREKLQILDVLWGERLERPDNPDRRELLEHRRGARQATDRIDRLIQDEILSRGIRFPRGGLARGLLDFPTTYHGRWVYLCWQSGEPRVRAWHEVDGGFAGRKPLTAAQAERMGREDAPKRPGDRG